MKRILLFLLCSQCISTCYALGPNELMFNDHKYIKQIEKSHDRTFSAEYTSIHEKNKKIILHQVLDKNEPSAVVDSLKQHKTVEIAEVENINNDDLLITFVRFDLPNSKVEQNLCRIIKNRHQRGCVVFQYVDTQKMTNQTNGFTTVDFTQVSENIKHLPLEEYVSTLSQTLRPKEKEIPWYDRPGAWAGRDEYLRRKNSGLLGTPTE